MAPETSRPRATSRLLTVLSTRVQGPCSVPAGSGLRSPRPLATSDHPLGTDSGPDRRAMRTGTARGERKALSPSAGAHACRPRSRHGRGRRRQAVNDGRGPRRRRRFRPAGRDTGCEPRRARGSRVCPRVPPSSPATPRLAAAGPRRAGLPAPSSPPACGADRREPRENHATQQTPSERAASAGRVALTSVCPQTPSPS